MESKKFLGITENIRDNYIGKNQKAWWRLGVISLSDSVGELEIFVTTFEGNLVVYNKWIFFDSEILLLGIYPTDILIYV